MCGGGGGGGGGRSIFSGNTCQHGGWGGNHSIFSGNTSVNTSSLLAICGIRVYLGCQWATLGPHILMAS